MLKIIKDIDPTNITDEYDVLLIGTSIACSLTNGLQAKIANKYPYVDEANNKLPYRDNRRLGKRLTLKEDGKPIISLLFICKFMDKRYVTVDYEALENCLATANVEFKGKKVLTTVLGGTRVDGNGDKQKCLDILEKTTKDMDVDVYDYEQMTRQEEVKKLYRQLTTYWIKNKLSPSKKESIEARLKICKENFVNTISYDGKIY